MVKTEAGKVDWSKLHKSPFPASSVYKTYDGWKVLEYNVMSGEIAHKWNKKGKPLFNEEQVEPMWYDSDLDDFIGLGDYWFWKD